MNKNFKMLAELKNGSTKIFRVTYGTVAHLVYSFKNFKSCPLLYSGKVEKLNEYDNLLLDEIKSLRFLKENGELFISL
jgi:hypothetical protein